MGTLEGRRIAVTGASRGIGAACCRRLAAKGASLALVARDRAACASLLRTLPGGPHDVVALDVTDEGAWHSAQDALGRDGLLHGLVTAAGVLAPIGPVGTFSIEAFRRTLDVNLVGTLLAVTTTLDALSRAQGAVVTLSGGGATGPFPRFDAYAASKAAVVRLTENLAVELAPNGVRCNAVAPGFVVSAMHEETLSAGPERVGAAYYERTRVALASGGDPPEDAADLVSFLVSDAAEGITGKLISARWDPWRRPEFRERLRRDADLATLRRIDDQFFGALSRPGPR